MKKLILAALLVRVVAVTDYWYTLEVYSGLHPVPVAIHANYGPSPQEMNIGRGTWTTPGIATSQLSIPRSPLKLPRYIVIWSDVDAPCCYPPAGATTFELESAASPRRRAVRTR